MQRHPSTLEPTRPRRRNRWVLVGGLFGGIALLTMLLAFGLSRDPTVIRSPLLGKPAPEFSLRTLDGSRTVQLSQFNGQVVVINFWASWCTECRVEHPALMAAWDRYRDQRVVFLGIAFGDRAADSKAYLAELGGDWPQLADPAERTALAYGEWILLALPKRGIDLIAWLAPLFLVMGALGAGVIAVRRWTAGRTVGPERGAVDAERASSLTTSDRRLLERALRASVEE